MVVEQLKLENQICFPVYAASRLIIREYQPYLEKLGITYPQYLVMLVLWEHKQLSVNEITQKLILNTNTVTPLLKRMEVLGLLKREKDSSDERKVLIRLTEKGKRMQKEAECIPQSIAGDINGSPMRTEDLMALKKQLDQLIQYLLNKEEQH
ncbi:MarR family transcriptional regulator [Flavobacterium sp. NRK F10]|uniref:HTH-type transcriptional regulator SarZ n=1 Tax=Flavobacterium sediminis TaxID=2201181 RepID=A0A2U8QRD7_9FLAO|nr:MULTISPECIES: MarR family transcriptional regulator [Flavobacterium]AWM12722.1 MarR family transcriptional regulator [Flavobacterium sediminis]MCO6173842.1 MarR family transcriptional regulator [Flavobacterium sp. NRK F10]